MDLGLADTQPAFVHSKRWLVLRGTACLSSATFKDVKKKTRKGKKNTVNTSVC